MNVMGRNLPRMLMFTVAAIGMGRGLCLWGQEVPKEAFQAWTELEKNFPKHGTWRMNSQVGEKAYALELNRSGKLSRLVENEKKVFVVKDGNAIDFIVSKETGNTYQLRSAEKKEWLAHSRILSGTFNLKQPWYLRPGVPFGDFLNDQKTKILKVNETAGGLVEIEYSEQQSKNDVRGSLVFDKNNRWSLVRKTRVVVKKGARETETELDYDEDGNFVSARTITSMGGEIEVTVNSFDPEKPEKSIFDIGFYGIDKKVAVPKPRQGSFSNPIYWFVAIGLTALLIAYFRGRKRV